MPPYIDLRRRSIPLNQFSDRELSKALGTPVDVIAKRRADVLRVAEDADAKDRLLESLSPPALAVLATIVSGPSSMTERQIVEALQAHTPMTTDERRRATSELFHQLVVLPLVTAHGEPVFELIDPLASALAPRLVDLDQPTLPEAPFVPDAIDQARSVVAAAMILAHDDVKITTENRPNRGQVKRIASRLGLDPDLLETWWRAAHELELVTAPFDGPMRPRRDRLLRAVALDPSQAGVAEVIAHCTPGPIAMVAARRRWNAAGASPYGAPPRCGIEHIPGLVTGTVGGIAACAARAASGAAAGHVTPSFEVFVPPESSAADLIAVGAFAEVVRLDRVVTYRITKASVGRAVAAGLTADEIVTSLGRLGRHGVPQNVDAAIRDWAVGSRGAVLDAGRVIVVDPQDTERAARALAPLAARQLAPGVFVVDTSTTPRSVAAALARVDLHVRDSDDDDEIAAIKAEARAARGPRVVPAPLPSLRAKLDDWRRGRPEVVAERPEPIGRDAPPADADDEPDEDDVDDLDDALDAWLAAHRIPIAGNGPVIETIAESLFVAGPLAWEALDVSDSIADLIRELTKIMTSLASGAPAGSRRVLTELQRRLSGASPPAALRPGLLLDQLEAAKGGDPIDLQLRGGRQLRVVVRDVVRRGKTTMVLVEDVEHDVAQALRLQEIVGILDVPPPRRWSPPPGSTPPPGHAPCPCGSGQRYRQCCRDAASAG